MPKYDPREILFSNDKIKRVLDKLIDGSLSDGGVPSNEEGSFKELYKLNIANAGKFSSDRTIKDYAENIWKIEPVKL